MVDFCYGWTLWLFLSWIPAFFFENYHLNLQASAMFSAGVLFAGVIGDTAGGVASDRLAAQDRQSGMARRGVIVAGFLGAFVFLCPVVLFHNLTVAAVCLSLAFFFAELIVGPIWAVPMDIAPRYAGSASGMMNFGFGVAGLVSPSSFGYLVDRTGAGFCRSSARFCCCCWARCWHCACALTRLLTKAKLNYAIENRADANPDWRGGRS